MKENLGERIARARAAAESLPALRSEAQRLMAEHRESQAARDSATAADSLAKAAATDARLPRAWRALLGGRYAAGRAAADENASAAATELTRRIKLLLSAAGQLRTVERALATARSAAAPLPELLRQQRLEDLRAAGDPASMELLGQVETVETRLAAGTARLAELDEAYTALGTAQHSVTVALDRLASAGDWGTYDTFFGGGAISSMVKHERIREADEATREVQRAWEQAKRELADVDIRADFSGPRISPTQRTFDIWFDNIFTDLSVQGKIRDQEIALRTLSGRLYEVARRLRTEVEAARVAVKAESARRNELLDS